MRQAWHWVASILMWIIFGWYWYLVMQRQVSPESLRAVALLAVMSACGLALTLWWVAHNKRLAARNRRLGAPEAAPETATTDHLGRPLAGTAPAALREARVVTVRVDDQGRKVLAAAAGVRD
jgi:hypothetical protein